MGYAWPTEEVVAAYRKLVEEWDHCDGRIRVLLAPDWTPACSDELYLYMRRLADEYDTGIMTHVLETRSEMVFNLKAYGKTAMRRLLDLGILGPDVSLDHFVWATDEDIAILADTGAVAVNNPGSNLRLSTGVCRTRDILDRGGRIMFGTDSISFSEREDFFQELRLALYLQRIPTYLDIGRLDSVDVLRAACANGAIALRMEDQLGSLAVGKEADLVLVKRDRIYWPKGKYDAMPVLDVLLDRADATDVDSVMIAGKLVLDQGVITTMDEAKVRAHVEDTLANRMLVPESAVHERWGQLGREVEPYVFDFFKPWAELPVEPAYVLNARVPPVIA
jgi:5-methylthioadenosine/S-adenosylhomocysteine deaminase